jgi:hypothetical protein
VYELVGIRKISPCQKRQKIDGRGRESDMMYRKVLLNASAET